MITDPAFRQVRRIHAPLSDRFGSLGYGADKFVTRAVINGNLKRDTGISRRIPLQICYRFLQVLIELCLVADHAYAHVVAGALSKTCLHIFAQQVHQRFHF